ncbi:hypothetical protein KSX_94050 [Ktedonospora formicarum]|uniref:Uncharacterized protein n=2 Tax=Ktedonospora formicarum TaxID=2778364 RepID=A0A8J3I6H7_9CHLR|nr:hypothetical protein KSX_94050 [Ktedonospora formicarum]
MLEYGDYSLSCYSVEWQSDDRHPYQSSQLFLWESGDVDCFAIIRNMPPLRRCRNMGRILLIQLSQFADGTQG